MKTGAIGMARVICTDFCAHPFRSFCFHALRPPHKTRRNTNDRHAEASQFAHLIPLIVIYGASTLAPDHTSHAFTNTNGNIHSERPKDKRCNGGIYRNDASASPLHQRRMPKERSENDKSPQCRCSKHKHKRKMNLEASPLGPMLRHRAVMS